MRPNIVLIHTHDTGRHLGVYGAPVATPHLRTVAGCGTLYRQAFCASPGCSASRSSMLTGLHPHECGMLGLAHRRFRLSTPERHLSHRLRQAGYQTHLVGFQHEVLQDEMHLLGYDSVEEGPLSFESPARAEAAVNWLDHGLTEPFFLNVGMLETHRRGDDQVFAALESIQDPDYTGPLPWLADSAENRADVAGLHAAVRNVDDAVGILWRGLEARGLLERTLFVFTTDHGVPFPRAKATLFDAGIGVALLVAGPGVPKGAVDDGMVSHPDLYPTWLELAGAATPTPVRGTSLVPRWRGEAGAREEHFAEITYHAAYDPARAIRTPRWKYIRTYADHPRYVWPNVDDSPSKASLHDHDANRLPRPPEALYDLAIDPMETENLVDDPKSAEALDGLRARLDAWMIETDDPLLKGPVPLPPGAVTTPVDSYTPDGGPKPTNG